MIFLIKPEDLFWRPSNLMRIPKCGFFGTDQKRESRRAALAVAAPEREHAAQANPPEEFYFVLEGTGRLRVGDET